MTTRPVLIRIAALLALVTAVGHLVGTLMAIPPEQTAMLATVETMKATLVPMPVGAPRTYMQIFDGNNFCTTLFLAVCAAQLFAVAAAPRNAYTDRVLLITALGLAAMAVISAIFFFPAPALFTVVASGLGLLARRTPMRAALRQA